MRKLIPCSHLYSNRVSSFAAGRRTAQETSKCNESIIHYLNVKFQVLPLTEACVPFAETTFPDRLKKITQGTFLYRSQNERNATGGSQWNVALNRKSPRNICPPLYSNKLLLLLDWLAAGYIDETNGRSSRLLNWNLFFTCYVLLCQPPSISTLPSIRLFLSVQCCCCLSFIPLSSLRLSVHFILWLPLALCPSIFLLFYQIFQSVFSYF